ncbi:MAG: hypothetical protein AAGF94_09235 [Pseudomonadota bacterium]
MIDLIAAIVLLGLLLLAVFLLLRMRKLSAEARALRKEIAAIQESQRNVAASAKGTHPVAQRDVRISARNSAPAKPPVASKPSTAEPNEFAESAATSDIAPSLPKFGAARRAAGNTGPSSAPLVGQSQLSLLPEADTTLPPLPIDVLIQALHFPQTEDDTEGFRALRRALRDHKAAQLIQAAQDVLTLLSQDGLYMDDFQPDRSKPELWRRFAQGERGGPIGALAGIRDRAALAMTGAQIRDDAVFRDATHHFLRRYDKTLAELEPTLSDQQIAILADTRTTRAFMLLGHSMRIFD